MKYICPVCGYDALEDEPADYNICPCCGTEFGYHDFGRSHGELRALWIARGAQWHSRYTQPPTGWSPYNQLTRAGVLIVSPGASTFLARPAPQAAVNPRALAGTDMGLGRSPMRVLTILSSAQTYWAIFSL